MAAHASPALQIQFVPISSQEAAPGQADAMRCSVSPLMTVGYLRRRAWACLRLLLPDVPIDAEIGHDCLRLVSGGRLLNDDMQLLQEFFKPPPSNNLVFVAYKPARGGLQALPRNALPTSRPMSAQVLRVLNRKLSTPNDLVSARRLQLCDSSSR